MRVYEDFLDDNTEVRRVDAATLVDATDELKEPSAGDFRVGFWIDLAPNNHLSKKTLRKVCDVIDVVFDACCYIDERSRIMIIDGGYGVDNYDNVMKGVDEQLALYKPSLLVAFNGTFPNVRMSLKFV